MLNAYARVFTQFITHTWQQINHEFFQDRLHTPVFVISESEKKLGFWRASDRTLGISAHLLLNRSTLEVRDVIKHEMAHQYADEILGAGEAGETPHGQGFRQACRILGISENATMAPQSTPSPILDKIHKLLALAGSQNEHEASLAMARAQALMDKYQLDLGDQVEEFRYTYIGQPRKQKSAVEQFIVSTLARYFNIVVVWIPSSLLASESKVWILEACGTETNLEVAEYVYDYLKLELEYLWHQHKITHRRRVRNRRAKREYQLGVMQGFMNKLSEERAARTDPGKEVIKLHMERLKQYQEKRHPSMRKGRGVKYRRSPAFKAGFAKGQSLEIRQGLKKKAGKKTATRKKLLK